MIPKFRAWDKRRKRMVEVTSINFRDGTIQEDTRYAVNRELYFDQVKLMQYTGLKDKNGIEIFEGDIVKWGHLNQWSREQPHRIAEVKFDPDIQFHSQVGVFNFGSFAYRDTTETDLEVIGNIYENSELLKEQNK